VVEVTKELLLEVADLVAVEMEQEAALALTERKT
jgi:hypothetical protein